MDGYLKANFKNEKQELHELGLEDCDFVPDDEAVTHVVFGREHVCPRCKSVIRISEEAPYCSDCNWDSLTDPFYGRPRCAA